MINGRAGRYESAAIGVRREAVFRVASRAITGTARRLGVPVRNSKRIRNGTRGAADYADSNLYPCVAKE